MWRRISVGLVAGLALAGILAGCTKTEKAPPKPGYTVTTCAGDYSFLPNKVECGTMVVEETRGSNNGRLVSLPVVIVHATAANAKADPVFVLHGGPGGGLVEGLPARLKRTNGPITNDRDWIYFDQRGTGLSSPSLDCGQLPLSDAGVTSDDGVAKLQACGKGFTAKGIDLSQYNSAVIAQDIQDLRKALKIQSFNLFGVSYGTRIALAVMQHAPDGVRAVVLDSTWPPEANATAPLPMLVSRETRQILAACAADPVCAAKYPDLERRFDERLSAWLKTPVSKDGKTYTADEVAAFLLDAVYGTESARALPASLDKLLKGDYAQLDQFLVAQSDYTEGQFFTTLCREEFAFERADAVEAGDGADPIAAATARDTKRFFPVCQAFAVGQAPAVENQAVVSPIPTLLLSADIDAGCPAELSVKAAESLSKSKQFTFANRTHGVTRQSACARAMVTQFLDTANPNVDATCLPADQPKLQFIYE